MDIIRFSRHKDIYPVGVCVGGCTMCHLTVLWWFTAVGRPAANIAVKSFSLPYHTRLTCSGLFFFPPPLRRILSSLLDPFLLLLVVLLLSRSAVRASWPKNRGRGKLTFCSDKRMNRRANAVAHIHHKHVRITHRIARTCIYLYHTQYANIADAIFKQYICKLFANLTQVVQIFDILYV